MNCTGKINSTSKEEFYGIFLAKLRALLSSESDYLANTANTAAFIFDNILGINWAGFYIMKNGELVLGPFCGKVACTRININKGVCGYAARNKETVLVENVHNFEGHIACDSASNSEIVIPILDKNNNVLGVLDIDSPLFNRFDDIDKENLIKAVEVMKKHIDFNEFIK